MLTLQGHAMLLKNVRDLDMIGLNKFLQNLDQYPSISADFHLARPTNDQTSDEVEDVPLDLDHLFEFIGFEQRKKYHKYLSIFTGNYTADIKKKHFF